MGTPFREKIADERVDATANIVLEWLRQMQINLRRTPAAVTEEELNRFNGNALFQQSRCKRMPQDMRSEFATQAALLTSRLDRRGQSAFGNRLALGPGKDVFGIAMNLPCFTQQAKKRRADWNDAFAVAFADSATSATSRAGASPGNRRRRRKVLPLRRCEVRRHTSPWHRHDRSDA